MNWISVLDKLPPDKHEVLYFAINEMGNREIMTGHRENNKWSHCCMFYGTFWLNSSTVKITHWMELPDYPKQDKGLSSETIKGIPIPSD